MNLFKKWFLNKTEDALIAQQMPNVAQAMTPSRGRLWENGGFDLNDVDERNVHWYRTVEIPRLKANARKARSTFSDPMKR